MAGGYVGAGSNIANADDVSFNTQSEGDVIIYRAGSNQKWFNTPSLGTFATATKGGQESVSTIASASGATTLDLTAGNVFDVTLTGNITVTISGATSGFACSCTVYLRQDGTGSRTVTWPGAVRWTDGTAPTLSTAANAIDIVVFETLDGGTIWYGSLVGTDFS